MRAIARLSIGGDLEQKAGETAYSPVQNSLKRIDYQAAGLDGEVQHLGAGVGERLADGGDRIRLREAEEASAAACAADLAADRAGLARRRKHRVDRRRRHAGRQRSAVVPLSGDLAPDFRPVTPFECDAHGAGDVANALETAPHAGVPVDVALGDFPVVDAGAARRVGVGEHDALLQLVRVDVDSDAPDAADPDLHRRDAAVDRRAIVLRPGRYADRLRLHVLRDLEDLVGRPAPPGPRVQRAPDPDVQPRAPRYAAAAAPI